MLSTYDNDTRHTSNGSAPRKSLYAICALQLLLLFVLHLNVIVFSFSDNYYYYYSNVVETKAQITTEGKIHQLR